MLRLTTTTRRNLLALSSALAVTLALGLAAPARAQAQTVTGTVRVITGSNGGSTSASLNGLSARLARQFPQFDTFTEQGMQRLSLSVGQSQSIALPGGGTATIQLVSLSGGEQELRISIPGGGTTMRTRGGLFFVGGAQIPGGTLILAIST